MKGTESYSGPWPRKRHSHTCVTCKRDRDQGAVACYKSKCTKPQRIESCECCRPLQPSATHRPPAPPAAEDDGGRTRIGNTPTCEDCGKSLDHCSCEETIPAPAYPATIKERDYHSIPASPLLGVQLDLFGGAR